MNQESLLKRIQELEREMVKIRTEIAPQKNRWRRILAKSGLFLISYWALMSFMAAIGTATYVKYAFNIDYFESYRNASEVKRISEFHREMGDELFLQSSWHQAVDSYQAAIAANPANTRAALGIVKARVMEPEKGRKFNDPNVVRTKLDRLSRLYPDDPQVIYLQVFQSYGSDTPEQTLALCEKLLARHPRFSGGYLLKAYIQQSNADIAAAAATLCQLLTFDPNNGSAHSNLGYCYLFTGQQELARKHLRLGRQYNPDMVNCLSLAEACRMGGDIEETSYLLDGMERTLAIPGIEDESFTSGEWLWNYLPEKAGDTESQRNTIRCYTMDQKRAILRISQGMLKAGSGDYGPALEKFRECLKLEPLYRSFLANKLRATATCAKNITPERQSWMQAVAAKLDEQENL
jgi:tetratricopeptide (TPR) repeat protein